MNILIAAFLIGVVAGLRAISAPAAVSWATRLGLLSLGGTWLGWLGYQWTPWIFTVAALGEIINDKLPNTPSRKVPPQFITRVLTGALSGAAIGTAHAATVAGALLGAGGAVVGTLGGAEFRGRLVRAIGGKDLPIALLEDCITVGSAILIVRFLL
ncbi:Uncharacterized membrane protein [Bryocella elongata]|uniref:Uncharacterized membrane protein n=2 Tax=Bryocella elongata TaxID=863522 RepID=A0A1H5ZNJ0_9BACT|nr:Uncharacterized membrane protein [Bryocella elongata]